MGSVTGIICVQQSSRLEELFSSSVFSLNTLLQPLWQIVGISPARAPASQCSRSQKYGAIQRKMCGLQRRFRWLWWAVHMSAETSARRYPIRKVITPVPVEGGALPMSAGTPFHGRRKPNGSACQRRTMAGVQDEAKHAISAMSPLRSCEVEKPPAPAVDAEQGAGVRRRRGTRGTREAVDVQLDALPEDAPRCI